jgi:hypothetical protein
MPSHRLIQNRCGYPHYEPLKCMYPETPKNATLLMIYVEMKDASE